MPIRCEIVSQDRMVYHGDVDMVILPGADGLMGILPHHSPVLTSLQFGVITVKAQNEEEYFTVAGGFAEVLPDKITVLADAAENVEEIDERRAEEARRRAEETLKQLKQGVDTGADAYMEVGAALLRSTMRLNAVRRYRRGRDRH